MRPNGTVSLSVIGWAEHPTVAAIIIGKFAVHKCRKGDTFGAGKHWDITYVPTGYSALPTAIYKLKDAVRVATLFDRCEDGSPPEKNPRMIRLYRYVIRWWQFDQGTSRENRVRARRRR